MSERVASSVLLLSIKIFCTEQLLCCSVKLALADGTHLTHVKVEALETPIPQPNDGELFTHVALSLVLGRLPCCHAVQYRHPHHGLWLQLHPG